MKGSSFQQKTEMEVLSLAASEDFNFNSLDLAGSLEYWMIRGVEDILI